MLQTDPTDYMQAGAFNSHMRKNHEYIQRPIKRQGRNQSQVRS